MPHTTQPSLTLPNPTLTRKPFGVYTQKALSVREWYPCLATPYQALPRLTATCHAVPSLALP